MLRDQCRHCFPTTSALSDRKLLLILTYISLRYVHARSILYCLFVVTDALRTAAKQCDRSIHAIFEMLPSQ